MLSFASLPNVPILPLTTAISLLLMVKFSALRTFASLSPVRCVGWHLRWASGWCVCAKIVHWHSFFNRSLPLLQRGCHLETLIWGKYVLPISVSTLWMSFPLCFCVCESWQKFSSPVDYGTHKDEPEISDLMEWISPEVLDFTSNSCQVNNTKCSTCDHAQCVLFARIQGHIVAAYFYISSFY